MYSIDLTRWKLTLPVDKDGGFMGTAVDIKPIPLDFASPPWFVRNEDGSLTFTAPADGATTSVSHYPRSELRELKADGTLAAWTTASHRMLHAKLRIEEMPLKSDGTPGRMVIGQIHGPDDELCRLYYDNGTVYFFDDKATDGVGYKETGFSVARDILLNKFFHYKIKCGDGNLTASVSLDGFTWQSGSEKISSFWPGKKLYFKAGVYLQVGKPGSAAGTVGTGQARARFTYIGI